MALTNIAIKNLKSAEKPYKSSDGRGLHLLVNPNGSRLWQFRYQYDGKGKLISFGPYPEISLLKARQMREEAREQVALGLNPSEERKRKKAEARIEQEGTFAKVADAYLEKLGKDGRKEETIQKNRWLLGIACRDFGDIPMRQITASTILKTLEKVQSAGTVEKAHRLRTTIGSVFRFAVARDLADTDPTSALRGALAKKQVKHHAAITDKTEFLNLMGAIDQFAGQTTTKIALKLLALMVPRPGELRAARWEEFDFDKREWVIPGERMKMGTEHRIPLAPQVIALLEGHRQVAGHLESRYVGA